MIKPHHHNVMRDLGIVAISIVIAILIIRLGIVSQIFTATKSSEIIGSFIAGLFFTSVFTTVPATIVLGQLALVNSLWPLAFFGALGSMCGDFVIFRFVKTDLSEDIAYIVSQTHIRQKIKHIFKRRVFRWFIPLIGALIIVSPLPDELGIALMSMAKIKTKFFFPISFVMNFLGILIIGLVAKSILN